MGFKVFKVMVDVEVILLFVQFCLGMSINLFVAVPLNKPAVFSSYVGGDEVLAHILSAF